MHIAIPKETFEGESRVAFLPAQVEKMVKKGAEIHIEAGLGESVKIGDEQYEKAGAKIHTDRQSMLSKAQIVLRLRKPSIDEVSSLSKGCIHISYLDPYNEVELVNVMQTSGITSISMEMIPRTTKAQKMDALSSQASLAGYVTVLLASNRLNKILPMMMTPAGTISPSKVFIIGVGVAGLQAIATAKRLGARVEAFDTRPVVEEQVKSLGGKFVKIDLGETGQTKDGYAKALTPEQLEIQRQGMAKVCASSDIVITTAQLFGRKAPVIITKDMIEEMKPGSIIVDMAVETGGNVEGSQLNQDVDINGVTIIGQGNLPGEVALNASEMYSSNLYNLLDEFWDDEKKELVLDEEDEIVQGCVITKDGEVSNARIKEHYEKNSSN